MLIGDAAGASESEAFPVEWSVYDNDGDCRFVRAVKGNLQDAIRILLDTLTKISEYACRRQQRPIKEENCLGSQGDVWTTWEPLTVST